MSRRRGGGRIVLTYRRRQRLITCGLPSEEDSRLARRLAPISSHLLRAVSAFAESDDIGHFEPRPSCQPHEVLVNWDRNPNVPSISDNQRANAAPSEHSGEFVHHETHIAEIALQ